jgi:hypothetical protein
MDWGDDFSALGSDAGRFFFVDKQPESRVCSVPRRD